MVWERAKDTAEVNLVLLGGFVFMLAVHLIFLARTLRFLKKSSRTKGTIVDIHRYRFGDKQHSFPVYQFVDQRSGEEFTITSRTGAWSERVGQEVDILYDPENPSNARIESRLQVWGPTIFFAAFACGFLVIDLLAQ